MKKIFLVLLAIVMFGFVQGCSKPVDVIGKWAEVDGVDSIEFTSSGTYKGSLVYDSQAVQKDVIGNYKVSGATVTLTSSADPKDSMVWTVSLENGILQVTYKNGGSPKLDGSTAKFKKVG